VSKQTCKDDPTTRADWKDTTLSDVLSTLKNGFNCKQDKYGVGDRVSRIESISSGVFDLNRVGFTSIPDMDREKFKLHRGDILFSHINSPSHVGKTAIFDLDEDVYHGVNLLLMRPAPTLIPDYLRHYLDFLYLRGYWKGICKQSVNQASVNQQDIGRVPIMFPTRIEEQERIVAILNEVSDGIAMAKKTAGKSIANAFELFESRVAEVFTARGESWQQRKLDDLCEDITVGHVGSMSKEYREDGVPFLRSQNIRPFQISLDNVVTSMKCSMRR